MGISLFQGGHHYCHYPYHSLASGQTTGREHSPTHQQNYLLVYYYFLLSFSFYFIFFHFNHCGWISATGPQVHGKMLNIISPINHKEMQIQTTMKHYHTPVSTAIIKNTRKTYTWNLEKWYRWSDLQNRKTHRSREQRHGHQRGKGEGGMNWDWHIYTLDTTYKITNENLLYSSGNTLQCSVVT